jgi:hypothetical protein
MRCASCGNDVPRLPYCIRCGAPLSDEHEEGPARRRGFAAAPGERRTVPRVVSTLFPHLPHAAIPAFQAALAGGVVLVVILAGFGLYPLALAAAAVLMPIVTLLYVRGVDLYEDEPAMFFAFTILWGAAAGVGVGLLGRAVGPDEIHAFATGEAGVLLVQGVLLPLAGAVLMLAGPLILLPYRRFNDVLDGTTFGVASAVTFASAEALILAVPLIKAGVRPAGAVLPWITRLVTLAIGTPLLAAAMIGVSAGAFWLRYRAPVGDRTKLGLFGRPAVCVPVAFAVLVGAACIQVAVPTWMAMVVILALDAIGLLALRQLIHLGLLEEASEREAGPDVVCANCGQTTPSYAFCGHCGTALIALPKVGARRERKLSGPRIVVPILGAVGAAAVAGLVLVAVFSPSGAPTPCPPGQICPHPAPPASATSVAEAVGPRASFTSSDLGFHVEFDESRWQVDPSLSDDHSLWLDGPRGIALWFEGEPASSVSPQDLVAQRISLLRRSGFFDISAETNPRLVLLGPSLGYQDAVAGSALYRVTYTSPQGISTRVSIVLIGATQGRTSAIATVIADSDLIPLSVPNSKQPLYRLVDGVLDTFRWTAT